MPRLHGLRLAYAANSAREKYRLFCVSHNKLSTYILKYGNVLKLDSL